MDIEVRALRDEERSAGGGVGARALRDDPLVAFLHGDDVVDRLHAAYDMFQGTIGHQPVPPLGALTGPHVVGVVGMYPPGTCFFTGLTPEVTTAPAGEPGPPGDPSRLAHALAMWVRHHPDERHWHIGPVGVEPGLQGLGIGSRMMTRLGEEMDADGEMAWLETEKPENVVFYRRHGFEVVAEAETFGLRTWFMRRNPR